MFKSSKNLLNKGGDHFYKTTNNIIATKAYREQEVQENIDETNCRVYVRIVKK